MIHGNRSPSPWLSEFLNIKIRNPRFPLPAPRSHNSHSRSIDFEFSFPTTFVLQKVDNSEIILEKLVENPYTKNRNPNFFCSFSLQTSFTYKYLFDKRKNIIAINTNMDLNNMNPIGDSAIATNLNTSHIFPSYHCIHVVKNEHHS
jgi:hypothetical protein